MSVLSCILTEGLFPRHVMKTAWLAQSDEGRGAAPGSPRFLYDLKGERKEWCVVRTIPFRVQSVAMRLTLHQWENEELWQALQPALQLVSRVLRSDHPNILALMDLRTRQMVPPEEDPRGQSACTEYLTKYVLLHEIDMSKTYPAIQELDSYGYDWHYHTLRMLDQNLRWCIGSAIIDRETGGKQGPIYGCTRAFELDTDHPIQVTLSAELIWPLLVPDYSSSERLVCSFLIASTLLHEYAVSYSLRCRYSRSRS
jgi:hypothetical protein